MPGPAGEGAAPPGRGPPCRGRAGLPPSLGQCFSEASGGRGHPVPWTRWRAACRRGGRWGPAGPLRSRVHRSPWDQGTRRGRPSAGRGHGRLPGNGEGRLGLQRLRRARRTARRPGGRFCRHPRPPRARPPDRAGHCGPGAEAWPLAGFCRDDADQTSGPDGRPGWVAGPWGGARVVTHGAGSGRRACTRRHRFGRGRGGGDTFTQLCANEGLKTLGAQ